MEELGGVAGAPLCEESSETKGCPVRFSMCSWGTWMVAVAARCWGRVGFPEARTAVSRRQHERGIGAEDVLIDVGFVGDDEPEAAQEGGNRGGMGVSDHPGVDHGGGHEYDGGGAEQVLALAHGHVSGDLLDAVGGETRGVGRLFPAHQLVVGECLGGVEHQSCGLWIVVQHGQCMEVEDECFTGGGEGGGDWPKCR